MFETTKGDYNETQKVSQLEASFGCNCDTLCVSIDFYVYGFALMT